ncbi:MAG TPA: hypothetical protein PK636_10850, partial [bacterium]|nr:hypothetical protein [bacterium]
MGLVIKIKGNPVLAERLHGLHHDRLLSTGLDVIIAAFVPGNFEALDALRKRMEKGPDVPAGQDRFGFPDGLAAFEVNVLRVFVHDKIAHAARAHPFLCCKFLIYFFDSCELAIQRRLVSEGAVDLLL